jgi:ABC-type transporter Mla subunit MlaD
VIRESLTGSVELDLVPGRSPEDLADGDTEREPIPGHQAPGLSDLSEQAGRIVAKVDRIADEGVLLMGDARGLVAALARKVEAVDTAGISRDAAAATAALKRTLEGLETRIDEIAARVVIASEDLVRMGHAGAQAFEQFEQDAAAFMASLKAAAEKIDTMVGKADPKVQAFLDSLVVAGRDLASLVKQFEGLGPEARGLVASVGGSVDRLTDTLDDAFHNLVDATEEIKSRPWILLNEPDTEEIAFDNIRIASTNYAKAAGEVREAAREIKDLLARPDAGSESVRRLLQEAVARFESSRDRYRTVEDELMRLLKGAPPGR